MSARDAHAATRRAAALAGAVALLLAVAAATGPVHPDRAFVSYRYAENLAAGHGLTYNVGDAPSEGYESLLWVGVCGALDRVGAPLPAAATIASLVFAVLCVVVLWDMVRRRANAAGTFVALAAFAASGPLSVAAMSGTGATLTALLVLLLVWTADRMRETWNAVAGFAVTSVLVVLGPLEALVAVPLALEAAWPGGGERPATAPRLRFALAVIVAAVAAVGYHAWRLAEFGHALPPAFTVALSLRLAADYFVVQPHDFAPYGALYLFFAILAVTGVRIARARTSDRVALVVAAGLAVVTFFLRDPLPALAGHVPLLALLVLPASHLVDGLGEAPRPRGVRAAIVSAIVLLCLASGMDARAIARRVAGEHDLAFEPLGQWLRGWRPHATFATDDPGAVSYYSKLKTTALGANAPAVAQGTRAGDVLTAAPEVIALTSKGIVNSHFAPEGAELKAMPEFEQRYRLLATVRTEWVQDRGLWIYVRTDVPELTNAERDAIPVGLGSVHRLNR